MRTNAHRQQGQVVVAAALAMGILTTSVVSLYVNWFGGVSSQAAVAKKRAYVLDAAERLGDWYKAHPLAMDGGGTPAVTGCTGAVSACLLAAAGITPKYGLVLDVGARSFATEGFPWRALTLWIPRAGVAGAARQTYLAANALVSARVNGLAIERANQLAAQRAVNDVAAAMQNGYAAWLGANKNTALDWFQPAGCGPSGINPVVDCVSTWSAASKSLVAQASGWTGAPEDPWGDPVEICNAVACGANDQALPYTLGVRVVTPWGQTLTGVAVEPLQAG